MRRLLLALALVPTLLGAQQVRGTTRSGAAFGDSSLFFSSDTLTSKTTFVTRAASLAQFRKGLSKFMFDSLLAPKIRAQKIIDSTGSMSHGIYIGQASVTNGIISFNADTSIAAGLGMYGGSTGIKTLFFIAPTNGGYNFVINGSNQVVIDSTGDVTLGLSPTTNSWLRAGNGTAAIPTYSYGASTGLGTYRVGPDTLGFSVTGVNAFQIPAVSKWVGGAASAVFVAGTGGSRTFAFQSTTAGGTATTFLTGNIDQSVTLANRIKLGDGTAAVPAHTFLADTLLGLYRSSNGIGSDTLGFSYNGATAFGIPAIGKLVGAAGNFTLQCGTGNSRTCTLQSTNSSGTAVNTLVLGADSSTTALGKIIPNTTKGIAGTATNDNAIAGSIGEYISGSRASGSSLSLSTGATLTVDSISITAGDWDVSGSVAFTFGATTSVTNLTGGINTTTNVLGGLGNNFDWETAANIPTAGVDAVWTTPTVRVSTASTIFVYLVAQGTFTASTLKGYGAMRARRIR